ncbi:N-glycosylase/DNA lyase [Haladaptatus litoreus]|uniref:N-glycosylase/DNA lyase n=1 Tax=Haladaptatus litoreus TaxID=553468 RepID=A0A1N7EK91_9EURY|nr:N-glycosylase/DNA lyase [Haladaptatus litoreus]SIR88375.1 N-glycosylase/DNA lyase [Haladaptatus litoreus]
MNQNRVTAVAEALAALGHDGIAAFDRTEPEYDTLTTLYDEYDDETYVKLLGIVTTTEDFQLNGNAQRFWKKLTEVALDHGELASIQDVEGIMDAFMSASVNARFNSMKRGRLTTLFNSGFPQWFVENHRTVAPVTVWNELAYGLNNERHKKTVVLSMKIFDIAHLIRHGEYLEFPHDIPIPCDLQVERVSRTSGIINTDKTTNILEAWAEVMALTSELLNEHISLLRIDSIVWQAGQIIGKEEPDQSAAREALISHFKSVGIGRSERTRLADELTAAMVE